MATTNRGAGLKVEDAVWVKKLLEVLNEFVIVHEHITANQMLTFLNIALEEGISQKDVVERTGIPSGTVARICAIMSDRGLEKRSQEALDLIRIVPSDKDYRFRDLFLSNKGRLVFNSLRAIMKGR